MRRVTVHELHESVVIEVGGNLDAVGAYDLRKVLNAALQGAPGDVVLDLSRVTSADDHSVSTSSWVLRTSPRRGRTLRWSIGSQALTRDLRPWLLPARQRPGRGRAWGVSAPVGRAP